MIIQIFNWIKIPAFIFCRINGSYKGGSSPANKIYRLDIENNVIKKLTTELPHDFYMHRIGFSLVYIISPKAIEKLG